MTAPQPGKPLPGQVASWANDDALRTIETATANMISQGPRARLRELLANVTRAWVTLFGSVAAKPATADQARPVAELAHAVLDDIGDGMPESLRPIGDGIRAAYVLGLKQSSAPRLPPAEFERAILREPPMLFTPYADTPKAISRQVVAAVHYADVPTAEELIRKRERDRIVAAVREELEQAKKLLDVDQLTEKGFTQVQVAIARADKIQDRIDNAVQWHLLNANQQAVTDTAKREGDELIWISERDACVVCLALNGDVVDPGDSFDVHATYGDPSKVPEPWPDPESVLHAPRHNRCRCRCERHRREQDAAFAEALKRESDRAIAYGWRTDSESGEVRRRAASELLARGVNLPKSVKKRAEKAIKEPSTFGGPVPDVAR